MGKFLQGTCFFRNIYAITRMGDVLESDALPYGCSREHVGTRSTNDLSRSENSLEIARASHLLAITRNPCRRIQDSHTAGLL
jgi:hypothetical protein